MSCFCKNNFNYGEEKLRKATVSLFNQNREAAMLAIAEVQAVFNKPQVEIVKNNGHLR